MSHAGHTHEINPELGWNPLDPHDSHSHAHGHVVVGWKLQLGVLAALLFFTLLTIGFYNAEQWAEGAFGIDLPNWVNIVGAMSIATIKAVLVCMFFMQLRYDKALNTFILLFCLFAVGLFLFFSTIDLATRDAVVPFKKGDNQPGLTEGGTGYNLGAPPRSDDFAVRAAPRVQTGGLAIDDFRRAEKRESWLADHPGAEEADWWAYYYGHLSHPARNEGDTEDYFTRLGFAHAPELSTPNRSRPRHGRTDALDLNPAVPADHGPSH
jgi:cytochrome c oxidase subunit 4